MKIISYLLTLCAFLRIFGYISSSLINGQSVGHLEDVISVIQCVILCCTVSCVQTELVCVWRSDHFMSAVKMIILSTSALTVFYIYNPQDVSHACADRGMCVLMHYFKICGDCFSHI